MPLRLTGALKGAIIVAWAQEKMLSVLTDGPIYHIIIEQFEKELYHDTRKISGCWCSS